MNDREKLPKPSTLAGELTWQEPPAHSLPRSPSKMPHGRRWAAKEGHPAPLARQRPTGRQHTVCLPDPARRQKCLTDSGQLGRTWLFQVRGRLSGVACAARPTWCRGSCLAGKRCATSAGEAKTASTSAGRPSRCSQANCTSTPITITPTNTNSTTYIISTRGFGPKTPAAGVPQPLPRPEEMVKL